LQSHADKGKKISDGDSAAFLLGAGPLLNERVNRDHKESSGEAEKSQLYEDCQIADAGP
jgi:hypothetical protein